MHLGVAFALAAVLATAFVLGRTPVRLPPARDGRGAARRPLRRLRADRTTLAAFAISGGLAGLAGIVEVSGQIGQLQPSISPGYGFTAITVAFLGRLHPFGILFASLVVALTFIGGESAQILLKLPLDLTTAFQGLLLLCVLCADALVSLPAAGRPAPEGSRVTAFEAILLTIVTASTPLLIAAIGELVAERSGVLNLGVEGMMAMGAACGFAAAVGFDSTLGRVARRDPRRRRRWRRSSPSRCWGFAANQVGSGLALTILGLGLSGLIGAPFVGARRDPIGTSPSPASAICPSSAACSSRRTPSSTPPSRCDRGRPVPRPRPAPG